MSRGITLLSLTVVLVGTQVADAGKMYWANAGDAWNPDDNWIMRSDASGANVEILVSTGLNLPLSVALDYDAGKMYFTDTMTAPNGRILRANLDGTEVEVLITGLGAPAYVALDLVNGKIYWTCFGNYPAPNGIQRANLDGSNVEDVVILDPGTPLGIALDVDGGKMYWCDLYQDNRKIQRANLDGSGVEDLIVEAFPHQPVAIALDLVNNKLYWTDNGSSVTGIRRANLDGSNYEELITAGIDNPGGIAVDPAAGRIFWTDGVAKKISSANLDGSHVLEHVTNGLASLGGIALDGTPIAIPTMSEWGLVVLTLLVGTVGTLLFMPKRQTV